jgi:hypothetical protein
MFRNNNGAVEPSPDVVPCDHPVPLSVLELDLGQAPVGGWAAYLADRGVGLVLDDVGRLAVSRDDARALLTEKREEEQRRREVAARQEQRLIEADEERRAQIWRGVPADRVPADVHPATAMLQSAKDAARPRRESVLQHALSNSEGITFHPYPQPGPEDDQ